MPTANPIHKEFLSAALMGQLNKQKIEEIRGKAQEYSKGGSITDLHQHIINNGGVYEGQRFERAADEVPGLERHYSPIGLRQLFSGDNAQSLAVIDPAKFEDYANPLPISGSQTLPKYTSNENPNHVMTHDEYIQYLAAMGQYEDVPWLRWDKDEAGLPTMPRITGHEGRHRSRAMAKRGDKKSLIRLMPGMIREEMPRRSREDYINAMKAEMAMKGNLILPEKNHKGTLIRPPIKLPETFKNGGRNG